jgi:hypothetical protein
MGTAMIVGAIVLVIFILPIFILICLLFDRGHHRRTG